MQKDVGIEVRRKVVWSSTCDHMIDTIWSFLTTDFKLSTREGSVLLCNIPIALACLQLNISIHINVLYLLNLDLILNILARQLNLCFL